MPLDDIEEQMEELEDGEERESGASPKAGAGGSGGFGAILAKLKKAGISLALFAVAAILAYFLLQHPFGGKGADMPSSTKTHEFGEQTVNLRDGLNALRLNVVVEVNDPRCLSEVASRDSLLRDKVIDTVSQKTIDELDGVVKRNKLKRELLDEFNIELNLTDGRLVKVYFREFYYFKLDEK